MMALIKPVVSVVLDGIPVGGWMVPMMLFEFIFCAVLKKVKTKNFT